MPTTLEQWYKWAFKLDWQYCQKQAESTLLHPDSMHTGSKFGKSSGGSTKEGKAPIVVMQEQKAPPPAMAVTLLSQSTPYASDAMDVDHAGRCPPIKCFNCGKLTKNKYGVLEVEETKDAAFCPIDPFIVTYYTLKFISKLCHRNEVRGWLHQAINSNPWKSLKTFICSMQMEQEVSLTVRLKTVDTHAMINVKALLDSGATGSFINHVLIQNNGITTHKLEHPVTVYNIDGTENKGVETCRVPQALAMPETT
jgi:hypothetical protein